MPTTEDIRTACLKAIAVFRKNSLECCLFGSAATALWGVPRVPNDVDVVVMTFTHDQEALKRMLASKDHDFTLVPSSNPRNTYNVVWCTIPGSFASVKVDVLTPGIMNIPYLAASHIVWFEDYSLPSMSLFPLLLLKLQGWEDHRNADRRRMDLCNKQFVDVADISFLLDIARKAGVHRRDGNYLSHPFLINADRRIRAYVQLYPESVDQWKSLGFSAKVFVHKMDHAQLASMLLRNVRR